MSSVDNRIVRMKMDTSAFSGPAQSVMGTLGKLQEKLKMSEAGKGLESLSAKMKGVDTSYLSNGVETVTSKFSALDVVAFTALQNITNSAMNAGKKLVKSLTIDPITSGFSEYELKLNSVQTIMAGTGESIGTVTKYLDELNTYSDRTIYSFADMTQNIGKFTNAGVKLPDAVAAIKGVANAAAISGANANEASRAMYNFAQALSQGSVKLIDWKSIELANMGTQQFKNTIIQTAQEVGTLTKQGGKWKSTTTDMKGKTSELFDATKGFNESLSSQWMTTEVLVKSLKKYTDENSKLGKSAYSAAGDIKSATQMVGVWQEAAQSGWATTWELVLGNFEEAKVMWTGVSKIFEDMINSSSKYRNENLKIWKDMGGRESMIKGFMNILTAIGRIANPIVEAFRKVLNPMNGKGLAALSKGFENLTGCLVLSERASKYLQKTFEGIFSIFKFFTLFLKPFGALFSGVFGGISKSGGGVADVLFYLTGNVGELITNFVKFLEESKAFKWAMDFMYKAGENLSGTLTKIGSVTSDVLIKGLEIGKKYAAKLPGIMSDIAVYGKDKITQISKFVKEFNDAYKPLEKAKDFVKGVLDGIQNGLQRFLDFIKQVGRSIKDSFTGMKQSVDQLDIHAIDIFNMGLFGAIAMMIKKAFDLIKKLMKGAGNLKDSLIDSLDALKDCLEAYQKDLKANRLKKIAVALLALAGAVLILSKIDPERLIPATAALIALGGALGGFLWVMGKLDAMSIKDATSSAIALIGLGIALNLAAAAMVKLSKMDWGGILKALVAMTGAFGIMIGALYLLQKVKVKPTQILPMITIAQSLYLLAGALALIGLIPANKIGKALLTIGATMAGISLFLNMTKSVGNATSVALSLIPLTLSLVMLAGALALFGNINPGTLTQGFIVMAIALGQFAIFMKLASGFVGNMFAVGAGIMLIAGAMTILASGLGILGNMNIKTLGQGLLVMAGALTTMGLALRLFPKNTLVTAIGIGVLGVSMLTLAAGLGAVGQLNLKTIAKGLFALAGTIGILAGATILLGPAAIPMLIMTGVIAAFGAAVAIVAGGVTLLAGGITALAGAMIAGSAGFVSGMMAIAATIPIFAAAIALGFVSFLTVLGYNADAIKRALTSIITMMCEVFIEASPKFAAAIIAFLTAAMDVVITMAPKIAEAALVLVRTVITTLTQAIPEVVAAILQIITSVLQSLVENLPTITVLVLEFITTLILTVLGELAAAIPKIVEKIVDIIVNIIIAIGEGIPRIVDAMFKMVIAIIDGFAEAIEENMPQVIAAVVRLIKAIGRTLLQMAGEGLKAGKSLLQNIGNGISSLAGWVWGKVRDFGYTCIRNIKNAFSSAWNIGKNFIKGIGNGIKSAVSWVVSVAKNTAISCVNGIKSTFNKAWDIGMNLIKGIGNGISAGVDWVVQKAKNMANSVTSAVKNFFGIHSPSRVFKSFGMYLDEGLAIGIDKFSGVVTRSGRSMAEECVDSVARALTAMDGVMSDNLDNTPVIKPVMDLSDVQNGINSLNGMSINDYNAKVTMDKVNDIAAMMNAVIGSRNTTVKSQNEHSIDKLINKIDEYIGSKPDKYEFIAQLNGKTLVDETIDYNDSINGKRQMLYERGIKV